MSCVFCKSLVGFTIDALVLVGSEQASDDLGDPEKHLAEAEQLQKELRLLVPLSLGQFEI